eukprot:m.34438 g.34438  ORF g.34438 m.34438 type:complete len:71 (+) comp8723_c0_seq2:1205-1417(+)
MVWMPPALITRRVWKLSHPQETKSLLSCSLEEYTNALTPNILNLSANVASMLLCLGYEFVDFMPCQTIIS